MYKRWKRSLSLFFRSWVFSVLVALLIATSFKSAIADWNLVPTGSMKPTIVEGDRIFVNKLAYDLKFPYTTRHIATWGDPERGEIVVFSSPADGRRLVKRVVGLPGDSIAMQNNRLFVNGRALGYERIHPEEIEGTAFDPHSDELCLSEDLLGTTHPVMITPDRRSPRSFAPVTVPEGQFFVMGDNRDKSADSRFFGFVDRSRIYGRATAIVASLDINHRYRPRWERFFTALP